jgi:hypothetical protein
VVAGGKSSAATRLALLFRGLDRAYGIYEIPDGKKKGKVQGKAETVRGEITPDLWDLHLRGRQGLGIVPVTDEGTCFFGAIDVDQYDLDMAKVEQQCALLGLPMLPTRTKSGGIHLYTFAAEAVSADLMRSKLEEWSVALGYGGAEIFPKQSKLASVKDVGNWINMPYFGALEGDTERYGIFKGKKLTLDQFVARAEAIRVTEQLLEDLALPDNEDFEQGPPCLQSLARSGFPEGMRNNGLFAVGVYLKKRYPDDWAKHLDHYNKQYLRPPLTSQEISTLTKTLSRKDYNYTCDKAPIKLFCNRNLCRTREFGVGKAGGDWSLVIGEDVQKIMTDPPHWIVTVNGQRLELFSEYMTNQRLFAQMCLEKINVWPGMLPADRWRDEVNKILQNAKEIEAPEDSGAGGELLYHLKQFCTVFPQAETRDEIVVGKPFTEEGRTFFRSADFKRFLESNHYRAMTGAKLYAYLRRYGLQHHAQYWAAGRNITVWSVEAYEKVSAKVPAREPGEEGM